MAAFARHFQRLAAKGPASAFASAPGGADRQRRSAQEVWKKSGDPHDDQINGDDEVEQPWNEQDENAGNERDDGLQMIDAEGHGVSPDTMRANNCGACGAVPETDYRGRRGGLPAWLQFRLLVCSAKLRH